MDRLQRLFQQAGGGAAPPGTDTPQVDTAEQVCVSSLALLKMLKHGKQERDEEWGGERGGRARRAGQGAMRASLEALAGASASLPRRLPRHPEAVAGRCGQPYRIERQGAGAVSCAADG